MYRPKSDCCNAPIQVYVGAVEKNISDQKYICSKCGKECKHQDDKCEARMPPDYLAKAREVCPKEIRGKVKDNIDYPAIAFNECISLCLPVVADLLKRVDDLSNSSQFRRVEEQQIIITQKDEELEKLTVSDAHREMDLFCANKKITNLEEEVKKCQNAIELILPMAKGYAYQHNDVQSNMKCIEKATQALEGKR